MECNVPVYQLRSGISRQLTTFRPDTRQKTLRVEPHQRLTLVQTEETGMVTRLWLTFPGWFWQHWNPNAEIDTTLLRCLILRIYFDGNPFPSVEFLRRGALRIPPVPFEISGHEQRRILQLLPHAF